MEDLVPKQMTYLIFNQLSNLIIFTNVVLLKLTSCYCLSTLGCLWGFPLRQTPTFRCIFTSNNFNILLSPTYHRHKGALSISYYAYFQG